MPEALIDHATLHSYIDQCVDDASHKHELFTVLFIQLRGMRRINVMLGYDAGDEALRVVVQRVRNAIPECDIVRRISSDEIVIVSLDCNSPSCAIKGSRLALAELRKVIEIRGAECTVDPVVGISVYPNDGECATELVRHAALAADRASASEDPYYAFFSAWLAENAFREFDLQQEIRKATSQKQFFLHYQPKVDSETRQLNGSEALIRWRHPSGTIRNPGDFIGVAERGGLMLPIGFQVLRNACSQMKSWLDRGLDGVSVSVNVTAKQFSKKNWVSSVQRVLDDAGIAPECLTLEITEECAVANTDDIVAKINELRKKGIKISIDDFGTGHSSLAYLSRLPVDEVKIDRAFVQSVLECETSAKICCSVVELAHSVGASVTAEGVETEAQAAWLRALGCDTFQGFLFGRPEAPELFEAWIRPDAVTGPVEARPI